MIEMGSDNDTIFKVTGNSFGSIRKIRSHFSRGLYEL
jgi:hypothetical protein